MGLIIAGIAYVHHTGQISPFQNSIAGDQFISGYRKLTEAVHDRGAKIALQIFHGGREAKHLKTKNQLPLAPSIIENDHYYKGEYRAITDDENPGDYSGVWRWSKKSKRGRVCQRWLMIKLFLVNQIVSVL